MGGRLMSDELQPTPACSSRRRAQTQLFIVDVALMAGPSWPVSTHNIFHAYMLRVCIPCQAS